MKKIMICAIIAVLLLFIISFSTAMPAGKIIYVDDDGSADFTSIQDAIDAASGYDKIFVYEGTYNEHICINKPICLHGEKAQSTIIKGVEFNDIIQVIDSENISISGFTIINNLELQDYLSGIFIQNSTAVIIENNIISGCYDAIRIEASHCRISQNILNGNKIGICFGHYRNNIFYNLKREKHHTVVSSNTTIISNNIILNSSEAGISIVYSSGNNITNNYLSYNSFGLRLQKSSNNKFIQNDLIDNTINAFAFDQSINLWNQNYWDKWIGLKLSLFKMMPYYIPGTFFSNIDWNPANQPNTGK